MKYLTILLVALALGACAKSVPPPVEQPPMIPVVLVNIEKTTVVAMPDEPSTKQLVKINKNDPADEALETTLDYTQALKTYSTVVTGIAQECRAELDDRNARLEKIKQYILLRQPTIQPVQ